MDRWTCTVFIAVVPLAQVLLLNAQSPYSILEKKLRVLNQIVYHINDLILKMWI